MPSGNIYTNTSYQSQTSVALFMALLAFGIAKVWAPTGNKFTWMKPDHFDEISTHMNSVDAKNCRSKSKNLLTLRRDVLSQLPYYNTLLSKTWYQNRSSLIHLHNLALNRAFLYSYILQKMNTSENFSKQPGWTYFYFSSTADVNANPNVINGSALYFDNYCHYPNWYTTVPFNKTLRLFGPKVYRWDDTFDQDNLLREPTKQVAQGVDYGAGVSNYTDSRFKFSPWYSNWMPDNIGNMDSLTKYTYHVLLRNSNVTASPSASEKDPRSLPVQFTAPYFDCGGSNKWVVSTYSPVIDYMPRYSNFTHLRRPRVVGVTVMDIYFLGVDFNPCGISDGNPGPNYLAGTARCKKSTACKHKAGYGFKKGGYTCPCGAGSAMPWYLEQPYQGEDIERATEHEFENSFTCTKVQHLQVLPIIDNLPASSNKGTDSAFVSGGMGAPGNGQRRQRSVDSGLRDSQNKNELNETSSNHQLTYRNKNIHIHKPNEQTLQEDIILADTLRDLRKTNRSIFNHTPSDGVDYINLNIHTNNIDRNNLDISIERLYQKDLIEHNMLSKRLRKVYENLTLTIQTLEDSVQQLHRRHKERFEQSRTYGKAWHRHKRASMFDDQAIDRMRRIFRQKSSVTASNCRTVPRHLLYLPGDVGYGTSKQFEPEGRTALRLAHFLSMYLQNLMPNENFGNLRGGGLLHVDQLFAEVLANVMGNFKIYSAGIFFDRYTFQNLDGSQRELFGPEAFRHKGSYYVINTAGYPGQYTAQDWFIQSKIRFSTNAMGTKVYKLRAYVRSDSNGTSSMKHEYFPLTYKAATYESGYWSRPYFRCDGYVDAWVMKYVVPFFGLTRTKLEFRGVVTVEAPLNLLEINQCPMPFSVPNAFKNTARCDYFSTKCAPLAGFPFMRGAYRCNCRLGFHYWHLDGKSWIQGSLVELEYEKKKAGLFSRFDLLTCRVTAACHLIASSYLQIMMYASLLVFYH